MQVMLLDALKPSEEKMWIKLSEIAMEETKRGKKDKKINRKNIQKKKICN